jgi:indolepyruvate ferredoxin oxidoreductase beta subunit
MSFDMLIVGIGGQGTILTSNILGRACVLEGIPVRGAETHGMAQRGGSVETHIRIGQEYGSLIVPGTADMILSFDLMESVRSCHYLSEKGRIVTARESVVPTSVFMQDFPPPDETMLLSALTGIETMVVDTRPLAEKAGSILTQNVVLLGAASPAIPLKEASLREAIRQTVPEKTVPMNLKAFELGKELPSSGF